MTPKVSGRLIGPTLVVLALTAGTLASASGFLGGLFDVWGPQYTYVDDAESQLSWTPPSPPIAGDATNSILRWNHVAMDANAIDHTPPASGDPRVFGEQLGPTRTSRAFAIIHIAMFEAVNSIAPRYRAYKATLIASNPGGRMCWCSRPTR